MKRVVIVTTRFPYFYTEAFLEAEYPYLKETFDEVVFLPLLKGKVRESCMDSLVCDDYNKLYSCKWKKYFSVLSHQNFYLDLWHHKSKLLKKNRVVNTFKQHVHLLILKDVVLNNKSLFDENTIVYSYWFNAPVFAFLKIREKLKLNYKVVCRAHRFDVYDDDGEMPNRTYCLRNIDKVFPISQDAINTLSKKYEFQDKFELCRLGVEDYGKIAKSSRDKEFHVLSVSQVHPRKRIREIFEALYTFAELHREISIIWTHFGDGPQMKDFKNWVGQLHQGNFTVYIKGRVPNVDIMSFMGSDPVDVFVNLSSSEGVPVSVMEAQSFGVPVIATDVGGTSEVMKQENGILLAAKPSRADVVSAFETILNRNFDRKVIKDIWNQISNAQVNFRSFVEKIQAVL